MIEHIKLLATKKELTIEEVKEIINYIVNTVSPSLDMKDSHAVLCRKSSMAVANLCKKLKVQYIPFSMNEVEMKELDHHFGIVSFNTEHGQICVLIDLTYNKFTEKTYLINLNKEKGTKQVPSPGTFVPDELKEQLVKSKYMTLTENNFEEYIGGFIESYVRVNNIDERSTYDKLYGILISFGINFLNEDYLNSQGKTY